MIRVLVVDDNPVIRGGLVSLLDICDEIEVVGQAGTGKDALSLIHTTVPHVVLMDVRMPVMDGVEATAQVPPATKVLMLTYTEDTAMVGRAIQAGARGYLVHGHFTPDELTRAIKDVHRGGTQVSPVVAPALFALVRDDPSLDIVTAHNRLTQREVDVLNLIVQGRSNIEIAETLFLSEKTVKNHINRAYGKLGVSSRAQAIATWLGTNVDAN